ncbi:MAG: rlmJ [Gammaproteobacteria bacterium]|jgi:23S rRNA (adenine2030-N6)-methyltransferase|nr:rlmJ [Gammaproteobacteria bacterium]
MNYRHGYHAGSFADVFKHAILVSLIQSLLKKKTAICYLDTHAGAGYYDLISEEAQKSKEFEAGITKVMGAEDPPSLIRDYLSCVQQINIRLAGSVVPSLRYYPGSPSIVRYFLRAQDRMTLTELHPQEYRILKKNFMRDSQTGVHLGDGYQGLKAFLPPKERRSLILIDPPYERPNEFIDIVVMLLAALKRFSSGVYAIWYPIKNRTTINLFYQDLKKAIQQSILIAELNIYSTNSSLLLDGCGMAIVNPPWQLDQQIFEYLPWLWNLLSVHQQGGYRVFSL